MRCKDLTGKTFGRWTVIGFSHSRGKMGLWLCRCSCGKTSIVYGGHLRRGKSVSCGCYRNELGPRRTHGQARKTSEYSTWRNMLSRCFNQNTKSYKDYGGRGVTVCPQWVSSFVTFYRDMGKKPTLQHTLERLDNNGNYTPDNCRWATRLKQRHNRRR